MENALAAIESLDEGEQFTYKEIADRYGVSRTTLSRRHRGV
jgi:ParB-like chromosome segregation protein Spo0J